MKFKKLKFKKIQGDEDVAQLAGYFPSIHEALGLVTHTHTQAFKKITKYLS